MGSQIMTEACCYCINTIVILDVSIEAHIYMQPTGLYSLSPEITIKFPSTI